MSQQRPSYLLGKGPKIEQLCSSNLLGDNCIYNIKGEEMHQPNLVLLMDNGKDGFYHTTENPAVRLLLQVDDKDDEN